jgi:hypothetical protein
VRHLLFRSLPVHLMSSEVHFPKWVWQRCFAGTIQRVHMFFDLTGNQRSASSDYGQHQRIPRI